MAALVHITRTPFGTVASATAVPCGMDARVPVTSFRPTAPGMGSWNGENPALRVRCMR